MDTVPRADMLRRHVSARRVFCTWLGCDGEIPSLAECVTWTRCTNTREPMDEG